MKIINSYIVEYKQSNAFLYEVETTSPEPQKFYVKYTDHGKDGWVERTDQMEPEIANALITPVPPEDEPPVLTKAAPAEDSSEVLPG